MEEAKAVQQLPVHGQQSERKIYVGNLPVGTTDVSLKQFCKFLCFLVSILSHVKLFHVWMNLSIY